MGSRNCDQLKRRAPRPGLLVAVFILSLVLLVPASASAQWEHSHLLDRSWSGDGKLPVQFPPGGHPSSPGVLVTRDGRVLHVLNRSELLGDGTGCVGGYKFSSTVEVRRYRASGGVDTTFGRGGVSTIRVRDASIFMTDAVLQTSGHIVMGGYQTRGTSRQGIVVRLRPDGRIDRTFGGGDGIAPVPRSEACGETTAIALQRDGRIVVAAARYHPEPDASYPQTVEIRRLRADGRSDGSFAFRGRALLDPDLGTEFVRDLLITPRGRIVAVGYTEDGRFRDSRLMVARLTPNGRRDVTFGRRGLVTRTYGDSTESDGSSATLDGRGRLLVVGDISGERGSSWLLSRLTPTGRLDPTFAERSFANEGNSLTSLKRVYVQPDGRLLAVGTFHSGLVGGYGFTTVARFRGNGQLDRSFINGGWFPTPSGTSAQLYADGRLLLGGTKDIYRLRIPGAGTP